MKNLLPLLFIIFSISLFTSCQNDKSTTTKKPKTEQRKKANQNKKKKPTKKQANKNTKPKPLPPLSKLKKSDKKTHALIKNINDKSLFKTKQPIRITEDEIKIKGVAIDSHKQATAAGVYLKIGNQTFKAKYGLPDKEIVKNKKKKKYLKSGFTLNIPKTKIKNGDYDINIYVVSSDRKTYFESKQNVKIKIR